MSATNGISQMKKNTLAIECMIDTLSMDSKIKNSFKYRYVTLVKDFRRRAWRLSWLFHGTRIIATVGSIITSSLLSIQYTTVGGADNSDPIAVSEQNRRIFWLTWATSFLVTVSNALLTLFKLDKKYYFVHTTLEQLISEGWQFLELTAKYSGFYTPGQDPTYENQYLYFCHSIEKIKMRQVEEEYYKLSELHGNVSGNGATGAAAALPPTLSSVIPSTQPPRTTQVPSPTKGILPMSPLKQVAIQRLPPGVAKYFQSEQSPESSSSTNLSEIPIENGEQENEKESAQNSDTA
jgi:hypothetical protein